MPRTPVSHPDRSQVDGEARRGQTVRQGDESRLDDDSVDVALNSLLSLYPRAPIAAVREDGVFVAPPESFPCGKHPVLQATSALDLVSQRDWAAVISAWDRALATGGGRCAVHLISEPDQPAIFQAFDVRDAYGVLAVVFIPSAAHEHDPAIARHEFAPTLPRVATVRKDERSILLEVDTATTQILGWTAEEMQGRRSLEFIHPDDHQLAIENWMEMLSSTGHGRRVRLRHRRRNGSWAWFEITNQNFLDDPDRRYVACGIVDISAEMSIQEELRAREQLLDRLAEAVPLGLFQVDTARQVVYTNDRLHQITDINREQTVHDQLSSVIPADRPVLDQALISVLDEGRDADIEIELRPRAGGQPRYCTINLRTLTDESGEVTGALGCLADVTQSTVMRKELKKQATFDELTGCHNRASMMLALDTDVAQRDPKATRAAIFIDLDNLKAVNDTLGHPAGDELLEISAERVRAAVRDQDIVGRIGGDEFLIMSPGIPSPEQAMILARRVADALSQEVRLDGRTLPNQASIGVAWSIGHGTNAEALVAEADSAMYESKREGEGQPKLAHPGR